MLKITPYFKWFDCWIGLFYNREKKIAYIQLIPFLGLKIERRKINIKCEECDFYKEDYRSFYCEKADKDIIIKGKEKNYPQNILCPLKNKEEK